MPEVCRSAQAVNFTPCTELESGEMSLQRGVAGFAQHLTQAGCSVVMDYANQTV